MSEQRYLNISLIISAGSYNYHGLVFVCKSKISGYRINKQSAIYKYGPKYNKWPLVFPAFLNYFAV